MDLVVISCQLYESASRLQWLVTPVHLWTGLVSSWSPNSFPTLPPLLWLGCRFMRSQVLNYPSPTPWLACRFMKSQVLYYPSPHPSSWGSLSVGLWRTAPSFPPPLDLLVSLWGVRSLTILPPPPGLLVGLWEARSFTILSPSFLSEQFVCRFMKNCPILPPPPWLACRFMRSQVPYYPSPTPWLACRFMRSQVLYYASPILPLRAVCL